MQKCVCINSIDRSERELHNNFCNLVMFYFSYFFEEMRESSCPAVLKFPSPEYQLERMLVFNSRRKHWVSEGCPSNVSFLSLFSLKYHGSRLLCTLCKAQFSVCLFLSIEIQNSFFFKELHTQIVGLKLLAQGYNLSVQPLTVICLYFQHNAHKCF